MYTRMSEKWDERNLFRYDSIPDIVFFFCLSPLGFFRQRAVVEKNLFFFPLLCLLFLRPSHWGTNLARTATLERSDFQWQRGEKTRHGCPSSLSLYKTGRQWAVISHQVNQKCLLHRGMGEKKWNGVPRNGPQKGCKADEWRKDPQKRFEKQNNNIRTNCTGEHSKPDLFSLDWKWALNRNGRPNIEARIFGGVLGDSFVCAGR